jgi:hypothetical protein
MKNKNMYNNEDSINDDQIIAINKYGKTVITNMAVTDYFDYEEDLESLTEENFNNILNNNDE